MGENRYSSIIQRHLTSLMEQADLTIEGLAEGTHLSSMTIRKILNAKTHPSQITLNKIAIFFNLGIEKLYSEKPIKLKKLEETPVLKDFYSTYNSNNTYFLSRAKENVVAHFIKHRLLLDGFLNVERRAKDIALHIKTESKYNKDFDAKVIAKVLDRMYKQNILERVDKTGKGAVFYYRMRKG